MSNALAIAAVTATLRNLLDSGLDDDPPLAGTTVTTRPLDKARENITGSQINLFLHHTSPNGALRNTELRWQTRPGETGQPPLALTLHYLLTAFYGESEDTVDTTTNLNRLLGSHRLLGQAMSILHENAVLNTAAINAVLPPADGFENPYRQVENVRITQQPLTLDEMSKLWTGFQTQYRLSVGYEVSAVLIESTKPARTPLPVLTIGPNDAGVVVQPNLLPPYPTLDAVTLPDNQLSALPGDTLTLSGHHLDGASVTVRLATAALPEPVDLAPQAGATATRVQVQLPNAPAQWPAGFYTVAVLVEPGTTNERDSNAVPFSLAPSILSMATAPGTGGDLILTVTCRPQARPEQRISFLLGSQELVVESFNAQTDTLGFRITDPVPGSYFVRLRVDTVDSLLIDRSVTPPIFDPTQVLTIP